MSNNEIKQKLDTLGVKYNPRGNKSYLEALLANNSSEAIQDTQSDEIITENDEKVQFLASYYTKGLERFWGIFDLRKDAEKSLTRCGSDITTIKQIK